MMEPFAYKTAVVDIDNTLWQFCDAFYLELVKINRGIPTPDLWFSTDFWEGYCSEEELVATINSIHYNQCRDEYKPYPESRDFLSLLSERGFHVILASHRLTETRRTTEHWLAKHRLPYDELHLSSDKTALFERAEVVIDDLPKTLEKAVESGALGAGLSFPWNSKYVGSAYAFFRNLSDILDYVLERDCG